MDNIMKGDARRDIKHSERERQREREKQKEKFTNFSQKSKEQYKSNEVKILGVLKHWAWMEGKAALKKETIFSLHCHQITSCSVYNEAPRAPFYRPATAWPLLQLLLFYLLLAFEHKFTIMKGNFR